MPSAAKKLAIVPKDEPKPAPVEPADARVPRTVPLPWKSNW